ncbi:MAG: GspE/PulE family protein [bacterium]|nr:GspE/PulE family protein [bacterium]
MSISQATLKNLIEKSKLVPKADLNRTQKTAQYLGCSIVDVLLGRNLLKEEDLGRILAKYYRVDFIALKKITIPQKTLTLIPESLAVERGVVVFGKKDNQAMVAMENPGDLELFELVKKTIGGRIKLVPFVATSEGIKGALKLYKKRTKEESEGPQEFSKTKTVSAPEVIDQLLEQAIREDSSDIHIEPLPSQVLIRFRIDGVLHDQMVLAKEMHASLVARIKVLSDLKLDEQRHPQDGRFSFQTKLGEKVSLRVSTTPTIYGEKVVLRILHDTLTKVNLEELGLLPEDQEVIERTLERTHGMFLVTGPTGSGKTTTLYTVLVLLNNPGVNIMSIEDPVENKIRRVNQIQVNPQINLDFAQGLRSMLRQDPDIIMVGEIRDRETAVIGVNAAITGHLVFSSVHANTAAASIPRMIDLGVEPFLLASTLNTVVAQRLVRILCPKCMEEVALSPLLTKRLDDAKDKISPDIKKSIGKNFKPKGCPACYHTGFRGRTGIFEVISVDDEIQELIVLKSESRLIWESSRKKGTKSMLEDGLIKVAKGITSVEEVFRVISE